MVHESSEPDAVNDLDDFEVDILERLIAGEHQTEVIVGDGAFARLTSDSLRDRVQPQAALSEIDTQVAERVAADESSTRATRVQGHLD